MLKIDEIQLQSLRVTEGWTVLHNRFYDLEPEEKLEIEGVTNNDGWLLFDQDLLQMEHVRKGVVLDLGWYPDEDPNGRFRVVLTRKGDWQDPILQLESKIKSEIVEIINTTLARVTNAVKV